MPRGNESSVEYINTFPRLRRVNYGSRWKQAEFRGIDPAYLGLLSSSRTTCPKAARTARPESSRPDLHVARIAPAAEESAPAPGRARAGTQAQGGALQAHHVILLTATPHKGDPQNFTLFLQLLDRDAYADVRSIHEAMDRRRAPFYLRRTKEAMVYFPERQTDGAWTAKPVFTKRIPRGGRGPDSGLQGLDRCSQHQCAESARTPRRATRLLLLGGGLARVVSGPLPVHAGS